MSHIDHDDIIELLEQATGINWHLPPDKPSFLRNGFHTEVAMIEAPFIVRRLQDAAISGTGRPRAIIFDACQRGRAMINIPREVAETPGFRQALSHMKPELRIYPARQAMGSAGTNPAHA
jgi:hypothetical protein